MKKTIDRHSGLLFAFVLLLAIAAAAALPGIALGAGADDPMTLQQIHDVMNNELSGQKALENVAYVYRGWRNTGGPWFNQVETWIQSQLGGLGFTSGENSSDDCYWIQEDTQSGSAWVPQYLSMQIVGPEGDVGPNNPAAYHFDHPAINTFDPTSPYYPAYMTQQWVLDNQRTPAEEAINDRCHLATSSAFTAPMNTPVATAETPAGGAIIADVVDVGTVSSSGTRTWSKHSTTPLAGKILFSSSATISSLMTLAQQQLAKAVMSSSALSNYSDPVINGVEVYPNNVRFSGGGSSAAPMRITLNISKDDVRFLTALCAQYDLTSSFPQMKLFAVGGTIPYSSTAKLHTLIVEIKGTTKADERIMEMAHVQEPGAEDNASGVGQQLEMLRTTKHLIDIGALPRPRRTMTFMWGNEMTMSALYKSSHPAEYNKIVAAFSNDMVGADQATTGAVYVLDKMPDPSARYKYQTDVLAGTTPSAPTQFLRSPDTHTLWGAGSLSFYPYPGHFLTDLYFESGKIMEKDSPDFDTRYRLKPSPWEGGSDAQPFLWNYDTVGGVRVYKPIPALATFFFTDYTYHSSMDTMKSVSAQRLRDVGLMSGVFAYYRANADLKSAGETVDIVKAAADQRFGWEKDNSLNHFFWALIHPYGSPATTDAALHEAFTGTGNTSSRSIGETQLLTEWGTWYKEAVTSARTMFDPADNTLAYDAHDAAARAAVDADMQDALANAQHLLAVSHFTTTSVAINGGAEWAKQSTVTLGLDASSFAVGGVTGMRVSDDGTTWPDTFQTFAGSAGCTLPAGDGTKTVYVQFQDSEGNVSATVSDTIKLDTTGPTVTDDAPAGWVNAPVTLHFTAIDGGSGADYTEWKVGNGAWTKGGSLPISSEGITAVAYRATDKVGNMSAETSCTVRIDTTTPTTTATRLQDAADTGWVNVAQTVNLSAAASGAPVTTFYRVDGGATQTYGAPFGISAAGSHPVAYWSIDAAGNAEAQHTGYINIDTGKPVCKALYDVSVKAGRTATLKCRLSDPAPSCGTATVKITISRRGKVVKRLTFAKHVDTHGPQRYTFKASLKKGAYTWTARATDVAGNVQAKASAKKLTVK